jgi:ABC-2 type transport system permease protein
MSISVKRLLTLIRKEMIQLRRDRWGMVLFIGLPLVQLFLYGYAVNTTVYHIPTAVFDESRDRKSRALIQALVNSQYFDITSQMGSQAEVIDAIDKGKVRAGLVIPPSFASTTDRGTATVLMLFDGSDSAGASAGSNAASLVAQSFSQQLAVEQITRRGLPGLSLTASLPIVPLTRVLYNPDMIDIRFLLPGLVGLLLQTLAVQQAALVIVRERELGTIEQILATPTRPLELVLSKMIPLLGLCLLAMVIIVGIGILWFGVPFVGNIFLFIGLGLMFIVGSLGLGMLVSIRSSTQKQALQTSMGTLLFGLLLSGMMYPRSAMPLIPQLIGDLVPLTYFVRIARAIYTRGAGLGFVWQDALALAVYSSIVILVAARNFKERLD